MCGIVVPVVVRCGVGAKGTGEEGRVFEGGGRELCVVSSSQKWRCRRGGGRGRSSSIGSSADRRDRQGARGRSAAAEGGEGPAGLRPVGDEEGWERGRSGGHKGGGGCRSAVRGAAGAIVVRDRGGA